jgi:hypothetical protein
MLNLSIVVTDIGIGDYRDIRIRSKDITFLIGCILNHVLENHALTVLQPRIYIKGNRLTTVDVSTSIVENELFGCITNLDSQIRRLKAALGYRLTLAVFKILRHPGSILYVDYVFIDSTTILFTLNAIKKVS